MLNNFNYPSHMLIKLLLTFLVASLAYSADGEEIDDSFQQISPTLILRNLNPAKGKTIWMSPEKEEAVTWMAYGGENTTTKVPVDCLEITLSDYTWCNDFDLLRHELHRYNLSKIAPTYHKQRLFKLPGSDITGAIIGESVFLGCRSVDSLKNSLSRFENDAWGEGGKRVYVQLQNGKKGLAPLVPVTPENSAIYDFLLTQRYLEVSGCTDFTTGAHESVLMKELQHEGLTNALTIQFEDEVNEASPVLSENFGLFIRDSNGEFKGGIWGTLKKAAAHAHIYIGIFFIDDSIRGTGLGLTLMDLVEHYAKSHDINLLALGTCDFQAPKFYEARGYKRDETTPKLFKGLKGEYFSSHGYYKSIE